MLKWLGAFDVYPLLVLLLTIVGFVYSYLRYINSYWKRNGVLYVKSTPFLGCMKPVVLRQKNIAENFDDCYNEFPDEPMVGIHLFTKPTLMIRDLELVKEIVVKNYSSFQNR